MIILAIFVLGCFVFDNGVLSDDVDKDVRFLGHVTSVGTLADVI
jgi:hypothetical protein